MHVYIVSINHLNVDHCLPIGHVREVALGEFGAQCARDARPQLPVIAATQQQPLSLLRSIHRSLSLNEFTRLGG